MVIIDCDWVVLNVLTFARVELLIYLKVCVYGLNGLILQNTPPE